MEKKKNIIIYVLCGIVVILLALCGWLVWQKNETKTEQAKDKKAQEEIIEEDSFVELDKEDKLVKKAYLFMPQKICGGLFLNLPETDKKIEEFNSLEKLNMIISIYEDELIKTTATSEREESYYSIEESELQNYFEDLTFMDEYKQGGDSSRDIITGKPAHEGAVVINDSILPIYVRYEDGKYIFNSYGTGCIGGGNDGYYMDVESAKKNSSELIISTTRYYKDVEWNNEKEEFEYFYYQREGEATQIDKNDKENLDHYDMVFNIKDNKLQLKEIKYLG